MAVHAFTRGGGGGGGGGGHAFPPPPPPRPQVDFYTDRQATLGAFETKVIALNAKRLTILRNNRGPWTVYA